ncbi:MULTISPECIES: hypothetical protein [unclassified Streptomyces]|uniref:hypothetical protein n=1 Tax=unclassified Streptomyces TaxID=2593676 RepID=UPI00380217A2
MMHSLDLYVTLVAAVAFGVLGLVGKTSQEVITSGVLAVLALVGFSLLRIRSQGDRINESLAGLARSNADRFFSEVDDADEIKEMISSSRELWLHGWTLELHLASYEQELRRAVTAGLNVRILVIAPNSPAMAIAASEAANRSAGDLSANLEGNLRRLVEPPASPVSGRLEIRTLTHVPHYTVIASDPSTDRGKIIMRLATFRANHWQRPTFTVTRRNDGDWYTFFRDQFEKKWESASTYDSIP